MKNGGAQESQFPAVPARLFRQSGWRNIRWLAVGLSGCVAFGFWLTRPAAPPPGVAAETVGLVRQLRTQPSFLRTSAGKVVTRWSPRLAERLSGRDAVERRRLGAYQSLIAAGTNLAPAAVLLVDALGDSAVEVRGFAFRVLANSGVPAAEMVHLARQRTADSAALAWLFAGLLRDESGPVREFAWRCLEAFTPEVATVRDTLAGFVETESDPGLRDRGRRLLVALPKPGGAGPVHPGTP